MEIKLDLSRPTKSTNRSWQKCIGSDHAYMIHRVDYQQQMKFVHDELGFEYIRFHGILNDEMDIIQRLNDFLPLPGGEQIQTTNFFQVGRVYDAVLQAGMKPFVEISFMPSALASAKKLRLRYKANIAPPKDHAVWGEFIQQFIKFLVDRYGNEEVESWYYEVWNEPDMFSFWGGDQKEYFELYKTTSQAIKSVNSKLRVGGPSTAKNLWLTDFQNYCRQNNLCVDFLSTHHYPGDAFGQAFNFKRFANWLSIVKKSKGLPLADVNRKLFYQPNVFDRIPKGILTEQLRVARQEAGNLPLFYTEWNGNSTYGAPIHDSKPVAAFIIKTILDNDDLAQMYAFWCLSDLFEEIFFLTEPFNGGFGLLSVDGIPKPNFWAFKLLSELGEVRYDFRFENGDIEAAVFKKENQIQILLYQQKMVENEPGKEPIHLIIPGLTNVKNVTLQCIDDEHCNPKRIWEEMGKPSNLKPQEVEWIKAQSAMKEEKINFHIQEGSLHLQTTLGINDVQLITLQQ